MEYVYVMPDESWVKESQPLNVILEEETEMSHESPENESEALEEPLEDESEPSMESKRTLNQSLTFLHQNPCKQRFFLPHNFLPVPIHGA